MPRVVHLVAREHGQQRRGGLATVRAIGPAVSWEREIGTMPAARTRPTVGLMPTQPLNAPGR